MHRSNSTSTGPPVQRWLVRAVAFSMVAAAASFVPRLDLAWAATTTFEHRTPATGAAPPRAVAAAGLDADAVAAAAEPHRRRAGETVDRSFAALGVSLRQAPATPVLVRTATGGRWGPWIELEFDGDDGPDERAPGGRPGVHSAPLWVGAADAYELNLPSDAPGLEVHLGRERRTRARVIAELPAAGAVPFIQPRSAWGARPPAQDPVYARDFRLAVVHHSASANLYGPGEVPGMLRSIQAYHMDVNGWSDIGYNIAVDRFGGVWEAHAGGVDRAVIGGHAMGFNTGSTGVVMLGEYGAVQPSDAAASAVAAVIAWKFAVHGVDPNGTVPYTTTGSSLYAEGTTVVLNRIIGHRDVGLTSCPGTYLYARLAQIRSLATNRFAAEIEHLPSRLFVGDFDNGWGDDVVVERRGSGWDPVWFSRGATAMYRALSLAVGVYRPVIVDFDGDQRADIFWHGPGSTGDHFWFGHPAGFQGMSFDVPGSYLPFAGDFDGDGRDDIYLYGEGRGNDFVSFGNADRLGSAHDLTFTGTYEPFVGDFDGDGHDDILLHDPGQGTHHILYGGSRPAFEQRTVLAFGTYEPFVGDFDGNGMTDIFWHDPGAGGDWIWFMTGRATWRGVQTQVVGRYVELVGDFDGNHLDDILWYQPGVPGHTMWVSDPTGFSARTVWVGAVYDPVVLDIDGTDLIDDILWYSTAGSTIWQGTPLGFRSFAA